MALLLKTHYELAKSSLRRNRGRSFLTCLGIAIGVAAIILILSLMGSVSSLVSKQVAQVGSNLIVVRPTSTRTTVDSIVTELTTSTQYLKSNLSLKDVETIKNIEGVAAVSPLAVSVNSLTDDGGGRNNIVGFAGEGVNGDG